MSVKVSVFGLGYVGCITSACLAREDHHVLGVDINPAKVDAINAGQSPIVEEGLDTLVREMVDCGRLEATSDVEAAVMTTDISLIAVGTPSQPTGGIDASHVQHTCTSIGHSIARKDGFHTVVVRSTILPGTLRSVVIPALEQASGKQAGQGFGIIVNPEFLREGSGIKDFYNPPFTLIGEMEPQSGDLVATLYRDVPGQVIRTDLDTAEMVKYVSNAFHGLKIAFANEVGTLSKAMGLDSHKVMDIFMLDTKLNLSARYLKPGFAFGGSCLPKDLRALLYLARHRDLRLPLLEAILPSNELQIENTVRLIMQGHPRVGLIGLSFKPGTDDLRESPLVEMVETLAGKGIGVKIYDENINLSKLIGGNKEFIEKTIPHISALMRETLEEVVEQSEVIVVAHGLHDRERLTRLLRPDHVVIDFVRDFRDACELPAHYEGLLW
jgi:GDP-mannose 6-dehydrogenase